MTDSRIVVITGAASGIGFATAELFRDLAGAGGDHLAALVGEAGPGHQLAETGVVAGVDQPAVGAEQAADAVAVGEVHDGTVPRRTRTRSRFDVLEEI